jgi:assimilatory nitrate reductase catalytic subunit
VHGAQVTCPLHNWVISLETGEAQGADEGPACAPSRFGGRRPHPHGARGHAGGGGVNAATVRTTCPYCGVGCGVLATPQPDGSVAVAGDPDHPANFGRSAPRARRSARRCRSTGGCSIPRSAAAPSWDEALDLVASTFSRTIAEHGPDSVAFYGSGQLLTEDYYVANKLMKGFIGSANIDTNSRLCMASSVAGHKRAFGSDTVPGNYEDLERADLVVLVGSNLAWCHPVLYQRLVAAKEARPKMRVVLIDPRRTTTADIADLHLAIRPGRRHRAVRRAAQRAAERPRPRPRVHRRHTPRLREALERRRRDWTIERVAAATGLAARDRASSTTGSRRTAAVGHGLLAGREPVGDGTDKVNAIINCHLATGRIGCPGMGPFSVTGQPNAMGGREVGGLANMLAAHMDFDPPASTASPLLGSDRVATKPGLKAVELFDAVADGRIKALWIMATNPVDSMPEADGPRGAARLPVRRRLRHERRDRHVREAHVRCRPRPGAKRTARSPTPSAASRASGRSCRARRGRPDWWIVTRWRGAWASATPSPTAAPARSSPSTPRSPPSRTTAAATSTLGGLVGADYDTLRPTQWPVRAHGPPRMFGDGRFFTPTAAPASCR